MVPKINGLFPNRIIDYNNIPVSEEKLADSAFFKPGKVDMLLGAGVWASIVEPSIKKFKNNPLLLAQNTKLGYVVYGQTLEVSLNRSSYFLTSPNEDIRLDELLLKYWNADDIPSVRKWTPDEERAEVNFVNTFRRDCTGRFVVTIPRKLNAEPLGNSYRIAKACFLHVEKKMQRLPELKIKYKEVMDDYIRTGNMIRADPLYDPSGRVYYMPHHPINFKEDSKGKFRVVFNASAASSNGTSFNDQQRSGPKLQADLLEIFLKFRLKRFGLTADIKQMFRQVRVAQEEWNFQRVFWRDESDKPLQEYVITVVSWGMTSAGYNSVRALRQCAIDGQTQFPLGARITLNDFYFDDMLSGAHSEEELMTAKIQITSLLHTAGFELAKWASNSKTISNGDADRDRNVPLECGILGMRWNLETDKLLLKTANIPRSQSIDKITKRFVISSISKVYDPSGLVLPIIVSGKILQQKIWKEKNIDWDDELPPHLREQWYEFESNIHQLDTVEIPRWLGLHENDCLELHVFSDASEVAMGAVAYLVCRNEESVVANLVTSRSKVAPIKGLTIPCLELSAAVMAAHLAPFVKQSFQMKSINTFFWTDSTIVLQWINNRQDSSAFRCK